MAQSGPFLQAYFRRTLLKIGFLDVEIAPTGADALEKLGRERFDLLLLDVDLPSPGGLELIEIINADPRYRSLPVVITSSVSQSDTVQRAITLGISDYLLKPYQQPVVEERLRRALDDARHAEPGRRAHGANILVAHRDRTFCDTLSAALAPKDQVVAAHSLAALVPLFSRPRPDLLLFEPDLLGRRLPFFAVALSRRHDPPPKLISVGAPIEDPPPDYLGWIEKTFTPAALADSVRGLLRSASSDQSPLETYRDDLVSVVRQAFGLMTGVEASSAPDDPDGQGESLIQLDLRQSPETVWRLTFQGDRETAVGLTAELAGLDPGEIEEEFVLAGFSEIANIVGGRLQRLAADAGLDIRHGLPQAPSGPPPANSIVARFRWRDLPPFAALLGSCQKPAE